MGLCKCPKRKVTNLFCYEHRVNVCEFCLVDNHPNCVVQSYLNWLTDQDYDPNCYLCKTSLAEGDTIRLNCLHLLHWRCFDDWAASFPATTAPAGYRCPCCSHEVFPQLNEVSPLIEKLREQLKQSNWARSALGLPILPELNRPAPKNPPVAFAAPPPPPPAPISAAHANPATVKPETHNRSTTPATHLEMGEESASYSISQNDVTFSRKKNYAPETSSDTRPLLNRDADNEENKYKRRPTIDWMRGLWRAKHGTSGSQERISPRKLALFVIFLTVLALITIITVLKRAGLNSAEHQDPMFDPMANPNIRIALDDSRLPHL
uniref:Zinc finger protein-like 1 homolog n=1 Tax=Caenorhabditis japonica TaxID=281687 RepID=A0A8R1HSN9_CAEJA